ncbi:hypothetical protein JOD63_002266 [Microbacterium terrae]|uniref:DUF4012 domain-containing protein n=1 Tax=Microbacterium terrae TaxID=69369 RepID=UPI001B3A8838|nr:DUF4012 domain-containing protein [Microbacterium terrae]MBP1078298.1 hypothetical protein [Microbacterium terrae]
MSSKPSPGRFRKGRAGNHAPAPQRGRRWPWIVLGVSVAVLTPIAIVGGMFASQAFQVRDNLLQAKSELASIVKLVKDGDQAGIQGVAEEVLALTDEAAVIVEGPLWDAAVDVPAVGVNIAAVRAATRATDTLVTDALPPALELLGSVQIDQLKVAGGGLNLEPFTGAIEMLPTVREAVEDAQKQVADVDRAELLPVVDDAVGQLLDVMDEAGPALDLVEKYLPTLLALAGANEDRTYVVLFQNNAEIRATGGNAANGAVVSVSNGKIELRKDEQTDAFHNAGYNGELFYEMPESTLSMYEWDFDRSSQNFTRTPDFPTSAAMYRALWQGANGGDIDGVISIDPVVLSSMMVATGPIKLADGTKLTADSVVKVLLSDTYERFGKDGDAADDYFSDVAGAVFDTVAGGDWDAVEMLRQLQKSTLEQRVYMAFTREAEQNLAVELGLDGALTDDNADQTQIGVWLNNASYSKLEYYLSTKLDVSCDAEARTVTSTLTMASAVPGWNLSQYTLAWRNPSLGIDRTTMILDVLSYAVPGGTLTSDPEYGDLADWTRTGSEAGRDGRSITMLLPMGETKSVSFTSTLPDGELGPLAVRYSPTVADTPVTVGDSCASLFPEAEPTLLETLPLPTPTPTATPTPTPTPTP